MISAWRRFALFPVVLSAALGVIFVSIGRTVSQARDDAALDKIVPLSHVEYATSEKLQLGEMIFDDTIMSGRGKMACSSCHDLATNGSINARRTVGYQGRTHRFNAPTIFNVANNYRLGWRGNFTSLAAQNEQILVDPNLMGNDWPSLLARLTSSEKYNTAFRRVYARPPDKENVLDVLVSFQRTLATPNARFDRYLAGETDAITVTEKRGYNLFQQYGCISCHQGSNIGGNLFQRFGIFAEPPGGDPASDGDLGRFTATFNEADRGFFRVPSLRNVAVTAPYFHDGRTRTLGEAVQIMANVQVGQNIPEHDIRAIVEFLNTLTGEFRGKPLTQGPERAPHFGTMPK